MSAAGEEHGASGATATLDGVTRRFGKGGPPALDAISLQIRPGRMTGLVGPDGAGKTTLIRLLAGLLDPDEGSVTVLGRPATGADHAKVGYMPQRFGLYEDLSVIENLTLYADLRGLPPGERGQRFAELLRFTDLAPFTARLAGRLSGGMKQKLGLACALVVTPRLLLLDEPGVGVDPVSRRELWAMVKNLTGEGIAVLWSTAYLDEAEKCDEVYLLNEGRMIHAGPPDRLTDEVAGRCFRVRAEGAERRRILARVMDDPAVRDATIQGASVRLLMGRDAAPPEGGEPIPPRFEDAFVDRLGGGPKGESALAAGYRTIPESDRPAIEAKTLTKRFGDFTAARDVSFSVPRGEIFGLLGPNGAGKSTTFKMLCGLLTPTSGEGTVAGHDLRHARAAARQSLGYMAQKFSLYGDLSVAQNLDFFAGVYGVAGRARREAIGRMVEIFRLGPYLRQNAGGLPLGFKQRLSLASAVMHEPPVLFLDEPTSGVDPIVRREFWNHINGLVDKGVTVLVTTHFMEEAEYCDRILVIYRAEQIAQGSPDELKAGAATPERPDPTLEEAFIALIEARDATREAA
ncbi:ATP-binding cassette domain-containing protein [Acuticoccus sediminis]|uniref:ATP-binding cassette domain-containing protein n=1 Tax=Acuticoccus sediminis TaxID=2184697 RepID=UPI001CFDAB2F|nr:ATP-binding cassette domain-containing protein [Acuticoccus sediminis]